MLNQTLHQPNRMHGMLTGSHVITKRGRPSASSTSLHEAGHAICLLANGYKVESIRSTKYDGGQCVPSNHVCPRVASMLACAGALAEGIEGHGPGWASRNDQWWLDRNIGSRDEREVIDATLSLLLSHRDQVLFLAARLDSLGTIGLDQLGEICREAGSPLAQYADRYPVRQRTMTRSTGRIVRASCAMF